MPEDDAEERELLRRAARAFFTDRAPLDRLVESEADGALDGARWRALAELGWIEVARPRLGPLAAYAATLVEESGKLLFPDPLVASLAVVRALEVAGDRLGLLPDVVAGRRIVVPALTGIGGDVEVDRSERLSGTIAFVDSGLAADAFLVGPTGGGWRLVEAEAEAVSRRPMIAMVGGRWAAIELRRAASRTCGDLPGLVEVGIALQAVFAAAAAGALLEATVAYVSERRQFGRAIGSFQAVQHTLASAAIAVDQSRALARRAVSALDSPGASHASRYWSAVAFLAATERFLQVARRCHQVWGGMGFSTETDVHHFSRRARWMTQSWGGRDRHLDVVARERLQMDLVRDRYLRAELA